MPTEPAALRRALRRERTAVSRALGFGVLVALCTIGLAGTSAWLIVRAAQRPAVLALSVPMGLVQLFALAKAAGRYAERVQTHSAALGVLGHVRAEVASQLEPLLPAGLGPRSADVVDVVLRDVDRVQDLLTVVAGPLLASAVAGLVTVAVSGLVVPWTAAVLFGALVIDVLALPAAAAWSGDRSDGELDVIRARLVALFDDAAQSGDEYVMAGATPVLTRRLVELEDQFDRAQRRRHAMGGAISALATLTSGATAAGALALCAASLRDGRLSPSLIAVPSLLAVSVLELAGGIAPALVGVRGDRAALARLGALGRRPAPVREPTSAGPLAWSPSAPSLGARAVTVAYGDAVVVRDVAFELDPGDVVVLAGPSGGGKTTLARVVAKFLDPTAGELHLDGTEYSRLTSRQVRDAVGFVDDAPYVFAASLAANLRIGAPRASDEELRAACELAGLSSLLDGLPEGLDTALGGEDTGLSGGERRRLGIARELLARRPVAVLDEPTEGLDEQVAAEVLAALGERYRDGLLVVLSHRPADLAIATRRLELRDGRVYELEPAARAR